MKVILFFAYFKALERADSLAEVLSRKVEAERQSHSIVKEARAQENAFWYSGRGFPPSLRSPVQAFDNLQKDCCEREGMGVASGLAQSLNQ